MAIQTINIGTVANDGTGDPLRTAWNKANSNFSELNTRTATAQSAADDAQEAADTAQAGADASIKSVNDVEPDTNGGVTLEPIDIGAASQADFEALAAIVGFAAFSVNGIGPDTSGNVALELADILPPGSGDEGGFVRVDEYGDYQNILPDEALATEEAAGFMSAAHVTALAALATALDGHDIESGVWTPTFSFSTPGDLSVDYHVQVGTYLRIGNDVFLTAYLEFTPTHTTASAGARLADVPFVIDADSLGDLSFTTNGGSTMPAYPSGVTELMLLVSASAEALVFGGRGSSTASNVGATQLTSGVRRSVRANCFYKADLTP
jgi:hypothetical protein